MKRTARRPQHDDKEPSRLHWAKRSYPVLIMGTVLIALSSLLRLASIERRTHLLVAVVLFSLLLLACGALMVALFQIIALLKAMRSELTMISARLDTEALDEIAADLTAIRAQMRKGVFGLLGS